MQAFLKADEKFFAQDLFKGLEYDKNIDLQIEKMKKVIEDEKGELNTKISSIFFQYWVIYQKIILIKNTNEQLKLLKTGRELAKTSEGWLWQYKGDLDDFLKTLNIIENYIELGAKNQDQLKLAQASALMFRLTNLMYLKN